MLPSSVCMSVVCVWQKAVVKQRQVEEELAHLQDALAKVVNEAGARTRQEVPYLLTCYNYLFILTEAAYTEMYTMSGKKGSLYFCL